MDLTYPPQPWHLAGHAHVGVFLVPASVAPPPHSAATRQLRLFGRVIVAAAFFEYEEPGQLQYSEFMATQVVLDGWRPRVSITHIWVDSPTSQAGGRDLWAIPKDLAEFTPVPPAAYEAHGIATARLRSRLRLPFAIPVGFSIAQDRGGQLVTTRVSGRVRPGWSRGAWGFERSGPVAFLAGRAPVLTLSIRPFRLLFGR